MLLDRPEGTATLPAGLGIDLGGIAKGWTVDQAAGNWASGARRWSMPAATFAPSAAGEPWPVAVQDPFDETRDLAVISLADSAVATSSIGGRRWQRNGQPMHHLIDPHTGQPRSQRPAHGHRPRADCC